MNTPLLEKEHSMLIPNDVLAKLDTRKPEDITSFYIHHGDNSPTETLEECSAEEMANPEQGFLCIGYNAVIRYNGSKWVIEYARPLTSVPAAQQDENTTGYALCVFGDYQDNQVPKEVLPLIQTVILNVKSKCKNLKYLQAHADAARLANDPSVATECCGIFLMAELPNLAKKTGLIRR